MARRKTTKKAPEVTEPEAATVAVAVAPEPIPEVDPMDDVKDAIRAACHAARDILAEAIKDAPSCAQKQYAEGALLKCDWAGNQQ